MLVLDMEICKVQRQVNPDRAKLARDRESASCELVLHSHCVSPAMCLRVGVGG